MLSIFDIQDLVSTSFFGGDMQLAGLVMYSLVLIAVFALSRKTIHTLLISLPVTLIFATLGVLSTELMVLLILVAILGLAFTARGIWRD